MEKIDKKELHELFTRIKENDEEAFDILYKKYNKMVYGICFTIVKNKENSEDVTQNVFSKLLKIEKEKMPYTKEATWLYTVTKNEALQYLKSKNNDVDLDNVYDLYIPDEEIEDVANSDEYHRIIKNLSEKQKEIVSLKVLHDFTFKEIGQMLSMKTQTVQWHYYKAINVLKVAMSTVATFILTVVSGITTLALRGVNRKNIMMDASQKETPIGIEDKTVEQAQPSINSEVSSFDEISFSSAKLESSGTNVNIKTISFGITGIFFVIFMIFIIIFKKSQQKLRKKSSK